MKIPKTFFVSIACCGLAVLVLLFFESFAFLTRLRKCKTANKKKMESNVEFKLRSAILFMFSLPL